MDTATFQPLGQRLAVYCGSRQGHHPSYAQMADSLGRAMAREGIGLVYGAADVGLMGRVANAVMAEGGSVIGVIPDLLVSMEGVHQGLTQLEMVASMHQRKQRMMDLADGLVALPGGFGTLEEMFEALSWSQLGLHQKRCGLLNVDGFFDPLVAFLDGAVTAGLLSPASRRLLSVATDPDALLVDVLS